MTRETMSSTGQAVRLLAPRVDRVTVEATREGYFEITDPFSGLRSAERTAGRTLAYLALAAKTQSNADNVRAEVGWWGPIPSGGLSPLEEQALEWLKMDPREGGMGEQGEPPKPFTQVGSHCRFSDPDLHRIRTAQPTARARLV